MTYWYQLFTCCEIYGSTDPVDHIEARIFFLRIKSYFTFQIYVANNKGADHPALPHRLVCTFVVRKRQSQDFSRRGPYDVETHASSVLRLATRIDCTVVLEVGMCAHQRLRSDLDCALSR